jgi:hypothetical protein
MPVQKPKTNGKFVQEMDHKKERSLYTEKRDKGKKGERAYVYTEERDRGKKGDTCIHATDIPFQRTRTWLHTL